MTLIQKHLYVIMVLYLLLLVSHAVPR